MSIESFCAQLLWEPSQVVKKDGTPYYVDGIFAPVLGPNGKPVKYLGVRYENTKETFEKQAAEGIVNAIKARKKLTQEDRDTLYQGRINPIATFSDVGTVIWGNKTLQVADTALNRLNVRRLLLQARRLIMSVSKRLLFDPNDTTVRNQFLSLVNPILDNIRKERGLTDFRVSVAMDIEDNDRNTLRGKIFIKPTPTLEFIELEFTVTPQNVSFDNI